MLTTHQKNFLKLLNDHDGRERTLRQFERWASMAYCSLAERVVIADVGREGSFTERYTRDEQHVGEKRRQQFTEMLGIACMALDESDGVDFFSDLAGEAGVLNEQQGQFFTPWALSRMMAAMTLGDAQAMLDGKRYITIGEPACGAGGMLLAAAQELREQGIDIEHQVWFDATDVSSLAYQMTYIQASIVGIAAIVRCQNTLTLDAPREWAVTMSATRFIARNGWPYRGAPQVEQIVQAPRMLEQKGQLALL